MKKVGLFISNLTNGGAERVVTRIAKILEKDYDVTVIINEDIVKYPTDFKIFCLNLPSKKNIISSMINYLRRIHRLKIAKKKLQLDICISFLRTPNFANVVTKTKKCKSFISIRNYDFEHDNLFWKFLFKKTILKSDYIIPCSNRIKDDIIERFNIDDKKIKTLYNPYDYESIEKLSREPIDGSINKLISSKYVLVTTGRFMYQKALWHQIKSFALLKKKINDAVFLIVGNGPDEGKVKKLVSDLKLEESVVFLGYQQNPFKYERISNVYLLGSLFEGFPNSMVEAMACGCAVIATNCKSGPSEILVGTTKLSIQQPLETKYGYICPEFTPKEDYDSDVFTKEEELFADAVYNTLVDKDKLRNYQLSAVAKSKEYNYDVFYKNIKEIIDGN